MSLLHHHLNRYHLGIQTSCRTDCQNADLVGKSAHSPQTSPCCVVHPYAAHHGSNESHHERANEKLDPGLDVKGSVNFPDNHKNTLAVEEILTFTTKDRCRLGKFSNYKRVGLPRTTTSNQMNRLGFSPL